MKPTRVLQETRKMRFEEAYEGWNEGRLTQAQQDLRQAHLRRYRELHLVVLAS